MQCIDEGKNNVFSIEHRVFGKCVFKFLTPDRNIKRYITKVHPAIQELYHRYPEHPHIATIQMPEEYQPNKFFVVIRQCGIPYKKLLEDRESIFKPAELLDQAFQIAHGLGQLQCGGINHRDVKPSNIIWLPGNLLKIIDFDISKTLKTDWSISTKTDNAFTIRYASPNRILMKDHPEAVLDYPSFKEDAFSLGLVYLEILLAARPALIESFNSEMFMKEPIIRSKRKEFQQMLKKYLSTLKSKLIAGERMIQFYSLIENLLSWEAHRRIDLMATCKYLRMVMKGSFKNLGEAKEFLITESQRSQDRNTGEICLLHQKEWGYINEVEENQEIKEVEYGALSQDASSLLVFTASNKKITSHKVPISAPGAAVLTTENYMFILGGEDRETGDTLRGNQRFKISSQEWKKCADIPDHGRSNFSVSYFDTLFALVGGYRENSYMASRILCFNMSTLKWEGDNIELRVKRLNSATCFTQQFLYIFGGLTNSGEEAIAYAGEIERVEIHDLQNSTLAQQTKLVHIRESDSHHLPYLKFMSGVAALINPDQIMIFGGLRDPGYDEETDGLLFNWKNNIIYQFRENWGITRTCFSEQPLVKGNTLFISQQLFKGNPLFLKGTFKDNTLVFEEYPSSS